MKKLQFSANSIIEVSPSSLIEYSGNSRTHSDGQIDQIVESIMEFGFVNPLLITKDNLIVAGHGRLMAAKKIGLTKVPAIILDHLSDRQRKALTIAENKISSNAGWDFEKLSAEIDALVEMDFDVSVLGFNEQELESLLTSNVGLFPDEPAEGPTVQVSGYERKKYLDTVEDEAPEIAPTRCQPGDLWGLGKHRLFCGDSTVKENIELLLDGARPRLMITDPPYGVNYDPSWRDAALDSFSAGGKKYINVNTELVQNDHNAGWAQAYANFPGDVAYVWHACLHASTVEADLTQNDFDIRAQIIWNKSQLVLSMGHYHWKHEPCFYAVRKKAQAGWIGDRTQTTVWEIKGMNPINRNQEPGSEKTGHSTQKPVECMMKPMQNHEGDVFDPFLGSGTTIIAAEQMQRVCYGAELSPQFCDIILKRWENFTGKQAVLISKNQVYGQEK